MKGYKNLSIKNDIYQVLKELAKKDESSMTELIKRTVIFYAISKRILEEVKHISDIKSLLSKVDKVVMYHSIKELIKKDELDASSGLLLSFVKSCIIEVLEEKTGKIFVTEKEIIKGIRELKNIDEDLAYKVKRALVAANNIYTKVQDKIIRPSNKELLDEYLEDIEEFLAYIVLR